MRPGIVAGYPVIEPGAGAQDDQAHRGVLSEIFCKHQAVRVGQPQIDNGHIVMPGMHLGVELSGVGHAVDIEAGFAEKLYQALPVLEVILHDNEATEWGHRGKAVESDEGCCWKREEG